MNAATDGSCSPPLELVEKLRSSLRACVPNYVPFAAPSRLFAASLAFPVRDSEIANSEINSLESRRKRGFQQGPATLEKPTPAIR